MGGVVSSVIETWPQDAAARFGREIMQLRHQLADLPMFTDEGLIEILDRYPREALGVFTMGHDLEDWRSWRRGAAGAVRGEALLEAVEAGRLWLNLRHANDHLPAFAALSDQIASEKERHFRTRILNRDLGVLISSPDAQVFYHVDVPFSSLWQLRGQKRIWFYPRAEPYVDPAWLERCVRQEAEGQMVFSTDWNAVATSFELKPGDMVTWPQNMPHRVDNGPMLNVSLSMEYMTPAGRRRADVLRANGVLRRAFGAEPEIQERPGPALAAELALSVAHKAWASRSERQPILPETFAVEHSPA